MLPPRAPHPSSARARPYACSFPPVLPSSQAGKRFVGRDEAVEYCLRDDAPGRPPTPPKVKQFQTQRIAPGERNVHPAYRAPGMPDFTGRIFGKVGAGEGEGTVHDIMHVTKSTMEEYIVARGEAAVYPSRTKEPLGKGYTAGDIKLPARTTRPDFAFGAVGKDGESAKEAVFPSGGDPDEEAKERVYEKSHRSFPPGAQRRTAVVWGITGVDPETTRFGKPLASTERNQVGKCLNPQDDIDEVTNKTTIIDKVVADYKAYDGYTLGQPRGQALLDTSKHPSVYGKPSVRSSAGDWGAPDCLQGDFTRDQQDPDRDLGRGVSVGFRHTGMAADPVRRFGLPSIRTDVPPRNAQSLATYMDFGDGPNAASLLFPGPYAEHGVEERDYMRVRTPSEIRALFAKIGYRMSDAEFLAVYERVSGGIGGGEGSGGGEGRGRPLRLLRGCIVPHTTAPTSSPLRCRSLRHHPFSSSPIVAGCRDGPYHPVGLLVHPGVPRRPQRGAGGQGRRAGARVVHAGGGRGEVGGEGERPPDRRRCIRDGVWGTRLM